MGGQARQSPLADGGWEDRPVFFSRSCYWQSMFSNPAQAYNCSNQESEWLGNSARMSASLVAAGNLAPNPSEDAR
jgi:hypothetical protein